MQRDPARLAQSATVGRGLAVDVHLPVERASGAKLSLPCRVPSRPRAAGRRRARCRRCPSLSALCAILDRGLRNRAEHEAPHRRQREQRRHDPRHDVRAHPARASGVSLVTSCERAVGRRDEPLARRRCARARRCRAGARAAQPCRTAASFQARLTASPMPVFMPWPPTGLWMCAASPSRNARPRAEMRRDAMVDVIGREPVDARRRRRPGARCTLRADIVPVERTRRVEPHRRWTVPMRRAVPSPFSGNTARNPASSSATWSSPFITGPLPRTSAT